MNRSLWTKKALAIPVCTAIVVGGVAFGASSAMADPADLSITSHSVSGRVLTVTGKGTPGENIQLDEDFRDTRQAIGTDGTWTITYTIPTGNDASQTYTIEQLNGLNQDGSATVTAAPEATTPAFAISSHSVSGRTITVSGTGDPADTVQIDPQGAPIIRHQIGTDGTWSFTYDIPTSAGTTSNTYNVLEENSNLQVQAQGSFTAAAEAPTPSSQFTLTSPKDGSTVSSRTVTFTGTGTPGDLVNLLDSDGNRAAPQVLVGDDGTWTTVGTFSSTATTTQALSVNQVGGGQGQGTVDFTIMLPAASTASTPLTVTTPKNGSTVGSRTVTFTGTGTPGDAVAVVNRDGDPVAPGTLVKADGTWSTTGTFSDSAAANQALVVGEVDTDLTVVGTVDLSITLPAVVTTPGTPTQGGTGPAVGTLPVVSG